MSASFVTLLKEFIEYHYPINKQNAFKSFFAIGCYFFSTNEYQAIGKKTLQISLEALGNQLPKNIRQGVINEFWMDSRKAESEISADPEIDKLFDSSFPYDPLQTVCDKSHYNYPFGAVSELRDFIETSFSNEEQILIKNLFAFGCYFLATNRKAGYTVICSVFDLIRSVIPPDFEHRVLNEILTDERKAIIAIEPNYEVQFLNKEMLVGTNSPAGAGKRMMQMAMGEIPIPTGDELADILNERERNKKESYEKSKNSTSRFLSDKLEKINEDLLKNKKLG